VVAEAARARRPIKGQVAGAVVVVAVRGTTLVLEVMGHMQARPVH
jgi:hypothetical protein